MPKDRVELKRTLGCHVVLVTFLLVKHTMTKETYRTCSFRGWVHDQPGRDMTAAMAPEQKLRDDTERGRGGETHRENDSYRLAHCSRAWTLPVSSSLSPHWLTSSSLDRKLICRCLWTVFIHGQLICLRRGSPTHTNKTVPKTNPAGILKGASQGQSSSTLEGFPTARAFRPHLSNPVVLPTPYHTHTPWRHVDSHS